MAERRAKQKAFELKRLTQEQEQVEADEDRKITIYTWGASELSRITKSPTTT